MSNKKIRVKLSDLSTQGGGNLSWERFEKRLIESGELTEQQKLKTIEVDKDGISYTTRKKQKDED